jgi:hypothetical protein
MHVFGGQRHYEGTPVSTTTGSSLTDASPRQVNGTVSEDIAVNNGAFGNGGYLHLDSPCNSSPTKSTNDEQETSSCFGGWSPYGSAGGRSPNYRDFRSPKSQSQKGKGGGPEITLILRGLPFNVTEAEVAAFVEQNGAMNDLSPVRPITLLDNAQGRPSGFAELHLNKNATFYEVHEKLHMGRLGSRYIEALPRGRGKFPGGGGVPRPRVDKRESSWRRF